MQGLEQIDWAKGDGLVPAIVQDADTGEVLMMAYMNRESLADSIRTGKTHFWSRSRKKYWMKGESSGHVQEITEIFVDCDADTILIKARQHGAACHEGYRNCFFRKLNVSGEWETCAQRLVDPAEVYGKK